MSHSVRYESIWDCDWCGAKTECDEMPPGWYCIRIGRWESHGRFDEQMAHDLCNECMKHIYRAREIGEYSCPKAK